VNWPSVPWSEVVTASSGQLRQADADAREVYGIEPLQLMEVAGWQVARVVDAFLDGVRGKRIIVVAGSGNNGGDALAAARFLQQRGAKVSASAVPSRDPQSLVAHHARTVRQLGIRIDDAPMGIDDDAALIVDGLLGTGVRPPLRPPAPAIIHAMNGTGRPIVAVDVPSGMDADTGLGAEDAVHATATVTLAAPKAGLARVANAGRIILADIGMPAALFSTGRQGLQRLYAEGDLVELIPPRVDEMGQAD
jgi:ADP-dependent NAD(P)H-hydrate dehydratase / NAD(P)H-hydrate epimerase